MSVCMAEIKRCEEAFCEGLDRYLLLVILPNLQRSRRKISLLPPAPIAHQHLIVLNLRQQ